MSSDSGTNALMGLLMDSTLKSKTNNYNNNKAKILALIQIDAGEELTAFLKTLDESEKTKLLSNSITKFGENVPLRQAIHHRSFRCIRSLLLAGAEVSQPDGSKAILGRNFLLFKEKEDARLAYIVLQSYQGTLRELPFASAPSPGTCMAMIARSHFTAWRLLPVLALLGLTPTVTPDHDDMKILAEKADLPSIPSSPTPSIPEPIALPNAELNTDDDIHQDTAETNQALFKKSIYDWLDIYYSTGHHVTLKNMCRIVIRKSLRVPDEIQVEKLRLPSTIKDYMLLRHAV